MQDFEKLGMFYLGKTYDLRTKRSGEDPILYNSKDLVTHAICVGMTGSGKTGLCLGILEEAAIDGIPSIAIDPKGDLPNILLTFPDLRPEDFAPWVNQDEARKKGLDAKAYAAEQADLWRQGLADWGQDGDRIRRLRKAADFTVYTPGSEAGVPVSILKSFAAPDQAILDDEELLRERIASTVTSVLGLLGIRADPIRSREHILLSTLLEASWRHGQDLDLPGLIHQIQTPPVSKVGVLDLETFYPAKDRFELSLTLNNLLAAPGFAAWMEGEPLDVDRLLHTPEGRPRVSIFSIAHLNDAERMFFVSILLNQILGWMRGQSGTSSLRAILYMDEIFGYFPPVANPPSKAPLLTMLKQARAFGVGVVLATQNPVDLDYKGLSNAGTWFLGRLQTERDKLRVIEGLEGAAVTAGAPFDRSKMEETLAGLTRRVFLLHDVHEVEPVIFQTRWTMSYLAGPLTRTQIKKLMDEKRRAVTASAPAEPPAPAERRPSAADAVGSAGHAQRPVLPAEIPQYFIPARVRPGKQVMYRPAILGAAQVRFVDPKAAIDATRDVTVVTPLGGGPVPVSWENARDAGIAVTELETSPTEPATYAEPPPAAGRAKNYDAWTKEFATWLFASQKLEVLASPRFKLVSRPEETERDFRIRLQHGSREERDRAVERLRQKYAPKIAVLQERARRAEQAVAREMEQATQQKLQTGISLGATVLGALFGRKTISTSTLGRATTAARGMGRSMREAQDIERAKATVAAVRGQLEEMSDQLQAEIAGLQVGGEDAIETLVVRPKKSNITVKLVALAWMPDDAASQG